MNLLEDLPPGPPLRFERAEADKAVIGDAVRASSSTAPAHARPSHEFGNVMTTRSWRRRAIVLAFAAVALALVVALVVTPSSRAPGNPRRSAIAGGHRAGSAHAWRLVSDLSSSWRVLASTGYEPDLVPFSCPTSTTCYADILNVGASENEIAVTHNGGSSWQQELLPVTLSDPAVLSCVDAKTCAALGFETSGAPTFLETRNGGQTWSSYAGPVGLPATNGMGGMSCVTATSCVAVPGDPVGDTADAVAFVTHDAGGTWSESAMPPGFSQGPASLRCTSASSCVVGGSAEPPGGGSARYSGAIAYTTNGGSSWSMATVPSGLGGPASISCGSTSNCLAIAAQIGGPTKVLGSTDGGETWGLEAAAGLPGGTDAPVTSLSCGEASGCWVGGIVITPTVGTDGAAETATEAITGGFLASTSDGGQSFTEAALPQGIGAVIDVSCPAPTSCFALASGEGQSGTLGLVLLAYGSAASSAS